MRVVDYDDIRLLRLKLGGYATGTRAKRVKPKARARVLGAEQRRGLVDGVAAILRCGDPTPFRLEAFCHNRLRSGLCLRGWPFHDADAAAGEVVKAALLRIGAKRPRWHEGQPEYTQFGVSLIERTRCIRCGWQLPEGHRKFCGPLCVAAHNNYMQRMYLAEEVAAVESLSCAA